MNVADTPQAPASLPQLLARDHVLIKQMCRAAIEALAEGGDRWAQLVAVDAFLGVESRHLAAVEDVLYPAIRRRLPDGRARARAHAREARALERMMRRLFEAMYGEVHEVYARKDELLADTEAWFDIHSRAEEDVAAAVEQTLPAPQRSALADAYERHLERAPTRPHPYLPHASGLGRLARRLWSVADRAQDVMDNRLVPWGKRRPPPVKPESLLSQYLTGQPRFPTHDRPERDRR
jgi:hypothetical protein